MAEGWGENLCINLIYRFPLIERSVFLKIEVGGEKDDMELSLCSRLSFCSFLDSESCDFKRINSILTWMIKISYLVMNSV